MVAIWSGSTPPTPTALWKRLSIILPVVLTMLMVMVSFSCAAFLYTSMPPFTSKQVAAIKATWPFFPDAVNGEIRESRVSSGPLDQAQIIAQAKDAAKHGNLVSPHKLLSPDYLPFLDHNADFRVLRRRLIEYHAGEGEEMRARTLAAAFLLAPAETMLAGIATVQAARDVSASLMITDHMEASEIMSESP